MTNNAITKILKSEELNNDKYSLGFRRFDALPIRLQKSLNLSYMISVGVNTGYSVMIENFEKMTENEYLEFLKAN